MASNRRLERFNGSVGGKVSAGSYVQCGDVADSVTAGSSVVCGCIGGNVTAGGKIECGGDIHGQVRATGKVICNTVRNEN